MQVNGTLTLGNSGALNVESGASFVIGQNATLNMLNGGTFNGNLVIANPIRVNFDSLTGSTSAALPTVAVYSGSGSIQVQSSTSILSNTSGTFGGAIGAPGGGLQIELNSLSKSFSAFGVTAASPAYPPTNSFTVAIGATKNGSLNGYLQINASISGSSDVVFTSNSSTGGGAGVTLLNAQCSYFGTTLIEGNGGVTAGYTGGSLILGVSNALPVGTDLEFGDLNGQPSHTPEIDMNGNNQQIGSLSANAAAAGYSPSASFYIANNGTGTATLTVSGNTTPHNPYGGFIVDRSSGSSGIVALVKDGLNTLTLNGSGNTYSGGTVIRGGILAVSNTAGSALGSGTVDVQSGGALGGSMAGGVAAGLVTVEAGGVLLPGGGIAAGNPLNLLGGLNLKLGSSASFNYGTTFQDLVNLGSSGLTLPSGSNSVIIDLIPQGFLASPIPLFSFSGSLTGSLSALELGNSAGLPPGFTFQETTTGSLNQIELVNASLANPTRVTWNGSSSSWNTQMANLAWTGSAGATYFQNNYVTTFPDISGSNSVAVTIDPAGVAPGGVSITSTATAYTFTGGTIGGYTALNMSGSSVVTLATSNSYLGGTNISGGTLVAAAGDASLGGTVGTLKLDNGATLMSGTGGLTSSRAYVIGSGSSSVGGVFNNNGVNTTLSGNVTIGNTNVASTFTTTGSGALTLAGNTSLVDGSGFGAVINVSSGSLQLSGPTSLGNNGSLYISPSATVLVNNSITLDQFNGGTYNGNLVLTGSARLNFNAGVVGGTGQILVAGSDVIISNKDTVTSPTGGAIGVNIVLNSNNLSFTKSDVTQSSFSLPGTNSFVTTIGGTKISAVGAGTLTVNGVISGNSDVNFSNSPTGGGSGDILLNAQNTYTGASLINFTGNVTAGAQGGIIICGTNNALPPTTDVLFGAYGGTNAWLDLSGNSQAIGSLSSVGSGGANGYEIINRGHSAATLTLSGATTPGQPFSGTIFETIFPIALIKDGSNTLNLANQNNFTGGTTVDGGLLLLNNNSSGNSADGTGGVQVNAGGTLGGAGWSGNDTTLNGGVAPGNPNPAGPLSWQPGTLNFQGNLFLNAGASANIYFASGSTSIVAANQLVLPSSGHTTVNVTDMDGSTVPNSMPLFTSGNPVVGGNLSSLALGNVPQGYAYTLTMTSGSNEIDLLAVGNGGSLSLGDSGGLASGEVIVAGLATPALLSFTNSAVPYTVTGGTIGGAAELVVSGGGLVTLDNVNDYDGGTIDTSGMLVAANAGAFGPGSSLIVGDANDTVPLPFSVSAARGESIVGSSVATVPEPGTLALLAAGLALIAVRAARRRKN